MSMKTTQLSLTAGLEIKLSYAGEYFELLESVSGVDVEYISAGRNTGRAYNMLGGYWSRPKDGFTEIGFISATTQNIKFVTGTGEGGYNRSQGSVQILNQQGPQTQVQKTATNANLIALAENAARRMCSVQNNDTVAVMRITVDGTAATATRGQRVMAGMSYDAPAYCPTGAINIFMETAGSGPNNIEVIEG